MKVLGQIVDSCELITYLNLVPSPSAVKQSCNEAKISAHQLQSTVKFLCLGL